MCTAFYPWQALNAARRDPGVVNREWVRAMVHVKFVCELYQEQLDAGRYFLHEHPVGASSWGEECIKELMAQQGVVVATSDRCQYEQEDRLTGDPVKKPTKWMTNSQGIFEALGKRCMGQGGACSRRQGGKHTGQQKDACARSSQFTRSSFAKQSAWAVEES